MTAATWRRIVGGLAALGAALVCTGAVAALAPLAHAAASDLVQVTTTPVQMPGPGHSSSWTMQIERLADGPVSLELTMTGITAEDAALVAAMTIGVHDAAGRLLFNGRGDALVTPHAVALGTLTGHSLAVSGQITLAREATNAVQGMTADLGFQVVATAEDQVPGVTPSARGGGASGPGRSWSELARTGVDVVALVAGGLALVSMGIVIRRRRHGEAR